MDIFGQKFYGSRKGKERQPSLFLGDSRVLVILRQIAYRGRRDDVPDAKRF